jgi:hypothetical protein
VSFALVAVHQVHTYAHISAIKEGEVLRQRSHNEREYTLKYNTRHNHSADSVEHFALVERGGDVCVRRRCWLREDALPCERVCVRGGVVRREKQREGGGMQIDLEVVVLSSPS